MPFHIETAGNGQAILFLHAGVADSRMWTDQLHEFSTTHRVIAFDKRGFGKTRWEPAPYSDTEDSLTVLDELGVDSAVVVGCSMGGSTALDLAIGHPERVGGLVLVGAFPTGWEPPGGFEDNPLEDEAAAAAQAGDMERLVEIDLKMWLAGYGRSEDDVDPALKEAFREMDHIPVQTEVERDKHQKGFTKNLNENLDMVEVPTLVVVGAHDEPVLQEAAHYLAERLSNHPAVVIEDAAHLPSFEQPAMFNAALKAFLSSF